MTDHGPHAYTLHPFGDEWLWTDEGTEPMRFSMLGDAVAFAAEYRQATIDGNPGPQGESLREFALEFWFAVYDGEHFVAYIDPQDQLWVDGDPMTDRIQDAMSHTGAWPEWIGGRR